MPPVPVAQINPSNFPPLCLHISGPVVSMCACRLATYRPWKYRTISNTWEEAWQSRTPYIVELIGPDSIWKLVCKRLCLVVVISRVGEWHSWNRSNIGTEHTEQVDLFLALRIGHEASQGHVPKSAFAHMSAYIRRSLHNEIISL